MADDRRVLRMADALPSAGLIKLHLGVTNQGKSQPQQQSGRDKQWAKGSRNCFECWPLAIVRLSIGNITLTPGALSLRADAELQFFRWSLTILLVSAMSLNYTNETV